MRLGRVILSFALAFMWLAMPVHCQLETISAASLFACADDADCSSPAEDDCADDFCDSLESGDYFPQKAFTLSKAPLTPVLFELSDAFDFAPSQQKLSSAPPATVPLLASSWHFVQRVASPPRAPSILS